MMLARHRPPTKEESEFIEDLRKRILPVLEATAQSWIREASGKPSWTTNDQRRLFDALREAPVWLCKERCGGCGSGYGCADTKKIAGSLAAILRIERCALEETGCTFVIQKKSPASARVIEALVKGFSQMASASIRGIEAADFDMSKRVKAAVARVDTNYVAIKNIQSSCPDRFTASALTLMKREGLIDIVENSTFKSCIASAMGIVQSFSKKPACLSIIKKGAYESEIQNGLLKKMPVLMRANKLGEWLLCQERQDGRFVKFGSRWVALVPEGACEGAAMQKPLDYILSALSGVAKPGTSRSEIEACLAELTK